MTDEERLSLLSFGRPGFTLPTAAQPFDDGDRQHFLGLYRGILGAPPVDIQHGPLLFGSGGWFAARGASGGWFRPGGSGGGGVG
jgi:hypothetical protein